MSIEQSIQSQSASASTNEREVVLRLLAASSFLIMFRAYLMAPLIPSLKLELHASEQLLGLIVPAFMLPYGFSTLIYGPISDRWGRRIVLLSLLGFMTLTTIVTGMAGSIGVLLAARIFAGISCGGLIPIALALLSDLYPYRERGRAIGWILGAIAGGMAFGSTLGALLNPIIGWRNVFFITTFFDLLIFLLAIRHRAAFVGKSVAKSDEHWFTGYLELLKNQRGRRAYGNILFNGMLHSGIFAWLGVYFSQRYGLGDKGIGLALLGYGVPGMLLGPAIGHLADRRGRGKIIPIGLFITAFSAAVLSPHLPLIVAGIAVTILSFGFDMTHPPLVGIVTSIDSNRRGQAMGINLRPFHRLRTRPAGFPGTAQIRFRIGDGHLRIGGADWRNHCTANFPRRNRGLDGTPLKTRYFLQ